MANPARQKDPMKRRKAPETMIETWLAAMGKSQKQLGEAAEMIGIAPDAARRKNSAAFTAQWSKAERMAMTAAWLGLPEWQEDFYRLHDADVATIQAAAVVIRRAMGISEPGPDPGEAPGQ